MKKNNASIVSRKTRHEPINILLIVCLVICYILTIIFNALAGAGNSSVFKNTVGGLSDKYGLDTTPAGWTFLIWSIIYLLMAMTFVFFLITIFKRNNNGYIYINPVVVSPAYCVVYGFNFLLNIAWLFFWDRELLTLASCDLFAIFITNVISLILLIQNIEQDDHLLKHEQPKIYWTYIIFASNGQAMYCTWTFFASLLNMTICLVYRNGVSMETAVTINLSLVLVIVLGWSMMDIFFLDKFTRFLVTPYIVVVWALVGVYSKASNNATVSESTINFLRVLMAMAICLLLTKMAVIIFRKLKHPFHL